MSSEISVLALRSFDPRRGRVEAEVKPGHTLAQIVATATEALDLTSAQVERLYVRVNAEVVPFARWTSTLPPPGSHVIIKPHIASGNKLRTVLLIVVAVAAIAAGQWYASAVAASGGFGALPVLFGSAQFTGALITTALTTVGTLLVNALVPLRPDKPDRKDSPAAINGWRNVANPNGHLPLVFGRMRMAPVYGGFPYIDVQNTNADTDTPTPTPASASTISGTVHIRALFLFGYGPLQLSRHRFGDTPFDKYTGVTHEFRQGLPDDAPFTLYDHQVVPTDGMGITLEEPGSEEEDEPEIEPTIRFAARDAAELEVIFLFPTGLFKVDTTTGDEEETHVTLLIEQQLVASEDEDDLIEENWELVDEMRLEAKKLEPFYWSRRWTPTARGRYAVRCTKDDDEISSPEDTHIQARVEWIALYAHRPEYPLDFPFPVAGAAFKIKTSKQLTGTLDIYNAIVERIALDWDAEEAEWLERTTRSPAAAMRLALQGPAAAWPRTDEQVDLEGLQDWSEYCADKGLEFNAIYDSETLLGDLMADIGAAGRAAWRDDGTRYGVVIDRPQTIVRDHISARNGWGFDGQRPLLPRMADAFLIPFRDERSGWEQTERVVPRPGFVGDPELLEQISLPGKTHPDEIYREAYRLWLQILHRSDTFSVQRSLDHLAVDRGDLVAFNHDMIDRFQLGTIVTSVTEVEGGMTQVTVDDPVMMEAGQSYAVRFRTVSEEEGDEAPPATSIYRTVLTIAGASQLLVLTGEGDLPREGDLALFGRLGSESMECIVTGIEAADQLEARITLKAHAPQIETLTDEVVIPPFTGRYGPIVGEGEAAPTDIVADSVLEFEGDSIIQYARVRWTPNPARAYQVRWLDTTQTVPLVTSTLAGVGEKIIPAPLAADRNYAIAVRVKNGLWSDWVALPPVKLLGVGTVLVGAADSVLGGT